ncbi:hypothetical protein DC3_12320 [Deinococcus cellulosilyticus NBRC 106333 = KACC 11606]|uniref:Uncharacterized protein n=2 Tax=Deinococcus cellulosilyticus TaxID=401558 RepID=A0A511MZJ1_DEIC1|nr:hypothetical protein DC3_12320 [Deinococcus cellulosilyticus NBRC 106333 = KACC 11606]
MLLVSFEIISLWVFWTSGRNRGTTKQRVALLVLMVVSFLTLTLLAFHWVTPDETWGMMVDGGPPGPLGRRAFPPLFWPLSYGLPFLPFWMPKLIMDDLDHPQSVSLNAFRFSFVYFWVHLPAVGQVLN